MLKKITDIKAESLENSEFKDYAVLKNLTYIWDDHYKTLTFTLCSNNQKKYLSDFLVVDSDQRHANENYTNPNQKKNYFITIFMGVDITG